MATSFSLISHVAVLMSGNSDAMWQTVSFGSGTAVGMMAFMLLLHLFSADLVFIGVCERCCLAVKQQRQIHSFMCAVTH